MSADATTSAAGAASSSSTSSHALSGEATPADIARSGGGEGVSTSTSSTTSSVVSAATSRTEGTGSSSSKSSSSSAASAALTLTAAGGAGTGGGASESKDVDPSDSLDEELGHLLRYITTMEANEHDVAKILNDSRSITPTTIDEGSFKYIEFDPKSLLSEYIDFKGKEISKIYLKLQDSVEMATKEEEESLKKLLSSRDARAVNDYNKSSDKVKAESSKLEKLKSTFDDFKFVPESFFEEVYWAKNEEGVKAGPQVKRFGMIQNKIDSIRSSQTYGILLPVEYVCIKEALNHIGVRLNEDKELFIINENPGSRVVLFDIISRDDGKDEKSVKVDHGSFIHTCVLWRHNDNIYLIDPNEEKFSLFLVDQLKVLGLNLKTPNFISLSEKAEAEPGDLPVGDGSAAGGGGASSKSHKRPAASDSAHAAGGGGATSKSHKRPAASDVALTAGGGRATSKFTYTFYSGYKADVGREPGESRDCIDISVKIAFEIQELMDDPEETDVLKTLYDKMSNYGGLNTLKSERLAHDSLKDHRNEFMKGFSVLKKIDHKGSSGALQELLKKLPK